MNKPFQPDLFNLDIAPVPPFLGDSKNPRVVRALGALMAGAVAADQSSNASASSEQCTSNAQAMLEHEKTDAKTMLEQCPSSSSSSINKTHTNAGVFAPDLRSSKPVHTGTAQTMHRREGVGHD